MLCPVCNGMTQLDASCAVCASRVEDLGRMTDLSGPYAPYESIEFILRNSMSELGMSAFSDCQHAAYCSACQATYEVSVEPMP